jgi:hypothetical protein
MEDADTQSFIHLCDAGHPSSCLLVRDDQRFLLMSFVRFAPCPSPIEMGQRKHKTNLTGQCFSNREKIRGRVEVFARSWLPVVGPVYCWFRLELRWLNS